jgi:hypothetical protein
MKTTSKITTCSAALLLALTLNAGNVFSATSTDPVTEQQKQPETAALSVDTAEKDTVVTSREKLKNQRILLKQIANEDF